MDDSAREAAPSAAENSDPVHWQRRSNASVDVKNPLSLCGIPRFRRPSLGLPTEWSKRDPVGIRDPVGSYRIPFKLFDHVKAAWSRRDPVIRYFSGIPHSCSRRRHRKHRQSQSTTVQSEAPSKDGRARSRQDCSGVLQVRAGVVDPSIGQPVWCDSEELEKCGLRMQTGGESGAPLQDEVSHGAAALRLESALSWWRRQVRNSVVGEPASPLASDSDSESGVALQRYCCDTHLNGLVCAPRFLTPPPILPHFWQCLCKLLPTFSRPGLQS